MCATTLGARTRWGHACITCGDARPSVSQRASLQPPPPCSRAPGSAGVGGSMAAELESMRRELESERARRADLELQVCVGGEEPRPLSHVCQEEEACMAHTCMAHTVSGGRDVSGHSAAGKWAGLRETHMSADCCTHHHIGVGEQRYDTAGRCMLSCVWRGSNNFADCCMHSRAVTCVRVWEGGSPLHKAPLLHFG